MYPMMTRVRRIHSIHACAVYLALVFATALGIAGTLGLGLSGCIGDSANTATSDTTAADTTTVDIGVRLHLSAEDERAMSLTHGMAQSTTGPMSLIPSANITSGPGFGHVERILIDVRFADNDEPFLLDFDLIQISPNEWEGQIPFLPSDTQLRFIGRAYNSLAEEIFAGETMTSLTTDNVAIVIPLAPVQDGQNFDLPRMRRIAYPAHVVSGQEVLIHFTFEANPGDTIRCDIGGHGAPFMPRIGSLTLEHSVADFIAVFTVPEVETATDFEYVVSIYTMGPPPAIEIDTNLIISVIPPSESAPGVLDTELSVLFRPVVLALVANGTATPGAVELFADIYDDSLPSEVAYQWSFTPTGDSPDASFSDNGQTDPTLLEGYTVDHQGIITFQITDADGGTTTVSYELAPNQFTDIVDHEGVDAFSAISAGVDHTCVLTGGGAIRCWGSNSYGQLGYSNTVDIGDDPSRLPYVAGDVPLLSHEVAVQVVTGFSHTCALLDSGDVRCWGRNDFGQLGYNRTDSLGDDESVTSFGYVSLGARATQIAAGDSHHTCAILEDESLRCWGYNEYGQLGYGHTDNVGDNEFVFSAGSLALDGPVKDVAVGAYHTCAVLGTGAMRCWGRNHYGQLGYGNSISIGDNETLAGLTDISLPGPVREMGLGTYHTCALLHDGNMRCWGKQSYGAPGYGISNDSYGDESGEVPLNLPSVAVSDNEEVRVVDMAVGSHHTCALLSDNQLKCWGEGAAGRLGYGNTNRISPPAAVGVDLDGVSVYQITAGGVHTCALRTNSTARCWGGGASGRLGSGATDDIYSPAAAPDIQIFTP